MDWERHEYYEDPWGGNDDLHRDGCLPMLIWGIVAALVCLLIGSCKTKYVAVPEYHTEYVYKTDSFMQRDSIYERDSIYVLKSGDTIYSYVTRYKYKDRWRDKIIYRDSIKFDSVAVPYPVVTNKVRFIDKLGYVGLGVIFSCVLIVMIWLISRLLRARSLV